MVSKRILVIQTAFIGDAILATSLLETLHKGVPGARIDLLVRKGNESLFDHHPYLDSILTWDKKGGKYKSLATLLKRIRTQRYDYVVNLQRYGATGLLTAFSKAGHKIGFDKNPLSFLFTHRYPHDFDKGMHETARNHLLAATLTTFPLQKPRLYPANHDFESVSPFGERPYYCIAPTSVWYTKQFPIEKWAKLISLLPAEKPIYLLGGPGDTETTSLLQQGTDPQRVVDLCGKLSLLQSAALMKGAVMNFVNDSAPMHLCSAVDAPVCVVYCSTVPGFGYGPLSTRSIIIETPEKLACRPCGIHGHRSCPMGHFACAMTVDVDQMAASAG